MTNTEAWNYAIGMIKADGLEPTEDFKRYTEKEKNGEATMEDLKRFLDKKYECCIMDTIQRMDTHIIVVALQDVQKKGNTAMQIQAEDMEMDIMVDITRI